MVWPEIPGHHLFEFSVLMLLQVLRHLPDRFSADVFGKLTDIHNSLVIGCLRALRLPQDLLACWVGSTPAVLDLRKVAFTGVHWSRLSAALLQRGAHLTEIHIRIPDSYLASLLQQERSLAVSQYKLRCQPCSSCGGGGGRDGGRDSSYSDKRRRVSSCFTSEEVDLPSPEQLRTDPNQLSIRECTHVHSALSGVLPQLTALQHVGLHNLQLQTQLITGLSQVLMSLPPSVTALTLRAAASVQQVGPRQRSILFNSIASVKSLRELHMPNWWDIVGDDESCVEPLYYMPQLQAVYSSIGTKIFALIDD
jgi:hypothetical protein